MGSARPIRKVVPRIWLHLRSHAPHQLHQGIRHISPRNEKHLARRPIHRWRLNQPASTTGRQLHLGIHLRVHPEQYRQRLGLAWPDTIHAGSSRPQHRRDIVVVYHWKAPIPRSLHRRWIARCISDALVRQQGPNRAPERPRGSFTSTATQPCSRTHRCGSRVSGRYRRHRQHRHPQQGAWCSSGLQLRPPASIPCPVMGISDFNHPRLWIHRSLPPRLCELCKILQHDPSLYQNTVHTFRKAEAHQCQRDPETY